MEHIGRWLLRESGLVKGYLRVDGDEVVEVCEGASPSDSSRCVVMPSFVNAHVHVGDSIAFPAPRRTLDELVAPPDGYKHRILRTAPRQAKIQSMRSSIELMGRTGTSKFIDFREEGAGGVAELREAIPDDSAEPIVLGRPLGENSSERDLDSLIDMCDGIGMSAISDWPIEFLSRVSKKTREAGKVFAIHASESVREDMAAVLGLRPSFVVHMTSADESDIRLCADSGVPIVICPRSNEFFGLRPKIEAMFRAGATLALGTDNCMISRPDMLEEAKAAFRISNRDGKLSPLEAVKLATYCGRKVLKAKANMDDGFDPQADLVAIRVRGADPLLELVTSASSEDVQAVIAKGRVRRSADWRR